MGVRDGDGVPGPGQHRHVVRHVAEGDDVGGFDAVLEAQRFERRRLADACAADLEQHIAGVGDVGGVAGDPGDDLVDLVRPPLGVLDQQLRHRILQQHVHLGDRRVGRRPGRHVSRLVSEALPRLDGERHPGQPGADLVDQPGGVHLVQCVLADHLTAAEVVDQRAVGAHRET